MNVSAGLVFEWGELNFTVDYFRIKVEDRIARSSEKPLTSANIEQLLSEGVADALSFSSVRFYTNDFDTTTQGVDVVAAWPFQAWGGSSTLRLGGNWTDTRVDSRNPDVIDDKRVIQLEENTPSTRFHLSLDHVRGPWRMLLRARHYDGFVEFSTDDVDARLDAASRLLLDAEIGFALNESLELIVGAENMLDEYPTSPTANISGLRYAETSPFGFNGGYYYARAVWAL